MYTADCWEQRVLMHDERDPPPGLRRTARRYVCCDPRSTANTLVIVDAQQTPGSHRLIADWRESNPDLRGVTPQVVGTKLADLPNLPFEEPMPVVARSGQVSVLTTSTVHGASLNVDTVPRKSLHISFTPEDVQVLLPPNQVDLKKSYDAFLRKHLRKDRQHIIPNS